MAANPDPPFTSAQVKALISWPVDDLTERTICANCLEPVGVHCENEFCRVFQINAALAQCARLVEATTWTDERIDYLVEKVLLAVLVLPLPPKGREAARAQHNRDMVRHVLVDALQLSDPTTPGGR